jgi:hypothetical protein
VLPAGGSVLLLAQQFFSLSQAARFSFLVAGWLLSGLVAAFVAVDQWNRGFHPPFVGSASMSRRDCAPRERGATHRWGGSSQTAFNLQLPSSPIAVNSTISNHGCYLLVTLLPPVPTTWFVTHVAGSREVHRTACWCCTGSPGSSAPLATQHWLNPYFVLRIFLFSLDIFYSAAFTSSFFSSSLCMLWESTFVGQSFIIFFWLVKFYLFG